MNTRPKERIILCKGDVNLPVRFWLWVVTERNDKAAELMKHGYVETNFTKFLTKDQLKFLYENQLGRFLLERLSERYARGKANEHLLYRRYAL